jgi:hypothetical protein
MRISAPRSEGIGLRFPPRDPDHEDPEWFQLDLDELESDDDEGVDPLPTERHRVIPDWPY